MGSTITAVTSLFALGIALGAACESRGGSEPDRLATGSWGGRGAGMEVTADGARLDYDCGHGMISKPLMLDAQGRFDLEGTYVQERPGPQREDEESDGQPARYKGRLAGATLSLTVTLADGRQELGTFTLTRGKPAILRKCL